MKNKPSFEKTITKTTEWIEDVMRELCIEDGERAYKALRTVLHALRDRLSVEETAHLGAQLPMLVRGIYYEGWNPTGKPVRDREDLEGFIDYVGIYFHKESDVEIERIAMGVLKVLSQRISEGEIYDVYSSLPQQLKELWPFSPKLLKRTEMAG